MRASLTITGIEVKLSVPAGPLETIVAGRYAPFLGAATAPVCSLHIQPGAGLRATAPTAPSPVPLVERAEGVTFRVTHPSFFGLFDLEGAGTLHSAADAPGLDLALRILFALLAPRHGALMLNACGVISNGGAHVFAGPAGARKTTAAGLAGDRPLLTDGYIMVRREGARWLAGSTPFWSSFELPGPPRESRLARLWSLRLCPGAEPSPAESGAALQTVIDNAFLPCSESDARRVAADLAVELAAAVPSSKLFLGPTSDVRQEIEASFV